MTYGDVRKKQIDALKDGSDGVGLGVGCSLFVNWPVIQLIVPMMQFTADLLHGVYGYSLARNMCKRPKVWN